MLREVWSRNMVLILADLATNTWILLAAIETLATPDFVGLATAMGAKSAGVAAGVFGRGYNKKQEQPKA